MNVAVKQKYETNIILYLHEQCFGTFAGIREAASPY